MRILIRLDKVHYHASMSPIRCLFDRLLCHYIRKAISRCIRPLSWIIGRVYNHMYYPYVLDTISMISLCNELRLG